MPDDHVTRKGIDFVRKEELEKKQEVAAAMGFNIWASGSGKFHYEKKDFIDGDDFDRIKLVNELMTMSPDGFGVADTTIGHYTPGITDLMSAIAMREFTHNLNNAVCFLAMCSGAANGWISVSSTETHWYWPDTKGFAKYNFQPGDNPGAEFIKLVAPGLNDTNLATWGVVMALGLVLSKYSSHIGEDATPIINISLDH